MTYSIVGGADAALFTIDASYRRCSASDAAPNFEAPTDADGNNVYDVVVSATDGSADRHPDAGGHRRQRQRGAGHHLERRRRLGRACPSSENATAVTTVDRDRPRRRASTTRSPAAPTPRCSRSTRPPARSASSPRPTSRRPADADGDNVYEVVVSASDGSLTDTQTLSVTVANVNEAPVITSNGGGATAAVAVGENDTAVDDRRSPSDPDSGVTYAIAGGADAALFAIDASTGALSFVAAPDFEAPRDADGDNVYEVIVSASDGSLTDTQAALGHRRQRQRSAGRSPRTAAALRRRCGERELRPR